MKLRGEASDEAKASAKLLDGLAMPLDNGRESIEVAAADGLPAAEKRELADALGDLGMSAEEVIPSIRGIGKVADDGHRPDRRRSPRKRILKVTEHGNAPPTPTRATAAADFLSYRQRRRNAPDRRAAAMDRELRELWRRRERSRPWPRRRVVMLARVDLGAVGHPRLFCPPSQPVEHRWREVAGDRSALVAEHRCHRNGKPAYVRDRLPHPDLWGRRPSRSRGAGAAGGGR